MSSKSTQKPNRWFIPNPVRAAIVALLLSAGTAALGRPVGQSPAAAAPQNLQRGITVQMPLTTTATPIPQADNQDAFIVAVTANGSIYLGVAPITLPDLAERAQSTPLQRGQAFYIKADARTPYSTVLQVLGATNSRGLIPQVLLTTQPESTQLGRITPPTGFEVSVGPPSSGTVATVVELLDSGQQRPLLKVNDDEISWSNLASTLSRHFQKGDAKVVLLKADQRLPFAEIVNAIDACRAAGAKVNLATPGR